MCAIVGSADRERFLALNERNAYRGSHSHSLAYLDVHDHRITEMIRGWGPLPKDKVTVPPGHYAIGHCQAPTSAEAADAANIHPAALNGALLWHNGIIKAHRVKELQSLLSSEEKWDTALLLRYLLDGRSLSQIDGSFACLWFRGGKLHAFRNEISPLFYDPQTLDLSSSKFPGAQPLPPNEIWELDLETKQLRSIETFQTKENPYVFL